MANLHSRHPEVRAKRASKGDDLGGVASAVRHCERQRSNPDGSRGNLDCFVAFAPRNDEVPGVKQWLTRVIAGLDPAIR
jgi:hypothetical protein